MRQLAARSLACPSRARGSRRRRHRHIVIANSNRGHRRLGGLLQLPQPSAKHPDTSGHSSAALFPVTYARQDADARWLLPRGSNAQQTVAASTGFEQVRGPSETERRIFVLDHTEEKRITFKCKVRSNQGGTYPRLYELGPDTCQSFRAQWW